MLRNSKLLVGIALFLNFSFASAQNITPVGGGGGGGSGTVTSIATSCGVSGGTITTTGTIRGQESPSSQTGTNYAFQDSDCGKLINLSNAANQVPTMAAAGSGSLLFAAGGVVDVCNEGAGTQTITPTTSTIGGAATYVLAAGTAAAPKCVTIVSDGTNYQVIPYGSSSSGANPTATASDTAVNGSATTFMRSDAAPAVQKATNAQFGLVEGDSTSISIAAGVAQRTALTGDVTAPAGSSATTLAAGNAGNLNSGTLLAARMPAMTGDCTSTAGTVALSCNSANALAYVSGNWYIAGGELVAAGVSNSNTNNSTASCYPFYFHGTATINALGLFINTVSAGGNYNVAIYASNNTTFRPTGTPLGSSGNLSTTSSAAVNGTVSISISSPRWLWACANSDNNTATARAGTLFAMSGFMGSSTQANIDAGSSKLSGVTTSIPYAGGWLDLTSATFTEIQARGWPLIQMKIQ